MDEGLLFMLNLQSPTAYYGQLQCAVIPFEIKGAEKGRPIEMHCTDFSCLNTFCLSIKMIFP
jgi:hypothetical protein